MLVYLISSQDEKERLNHIQDLKEKFMGLVNIEAVYPNKTPIPFIQTIRVISKHRTGTALTNGQLGCLLSHRKTWKKFLNQISSEYCLITVTISPVDNVLTLYFLTLNIYTNTSSIIWVCRVIYISSFT